MTRVLLIRHGETNSLGKVLAGRTSGIHLTEDGRRQVDKLCARLESYEELAAVVSSPMERTMETAEILASARGLNIEVDGRFNEFDFGEWTGKTFAELSSHTLWGEYNRYRSIHRAPGGESLIEVQGRAWKGVQALCGGFPEATVAIVSHADVIRSVLMLALGMPLDNILRLDIPPASMSEISVGAGEPTVHRIGIL